MNRQPHGKYRALPGSLIAVTSPPIMRASLRDNARPNPVPRCQRIGLGEVLEQFRLSVRQSVPPPLLCELSGQAHHDSDTLSTRGAKSLVIFPPARRRSLPLPESHTKIVFYAGTK
jgi:hypothetical protein